MPKTKFTIPVTTMAVVCPLSGVHNEVNCLLCHHNLLDLVISIFKVTGSIIKLLVM
jgi:hypothetical protein